MSYVPTNSIYIGIANYLLYRKELVRGTIEYGHAFEHFVIQEIIAYLGYTGSRERLSYWHTYSGNEVDAIIGDRIAIEIKAADLVKPKHLKGLKAFAEEYSGFERILVSLDPITRTTEDGIRLIYIHDFLKLLWTNQLSSYNTKS